MPRGQRNTTETAPAARKTPADKAVDEFNAIKTKLDAAVTRKSTAEQTVAEATKEISYREQLLAAARLNPDLPEGFDPDAVVQQGEPIEAPPTEVEKNEAATTVETAVAPETSAASATADDDDPFAGH